MVSDSSAASKRVDDVLERFRLSGGRVTSARRAIVRTLLEGDHHEHLTADDVALRIQASSPEIAVSTVYRSLETLEQLGVVEHIHVGHGPTVYHLVDESHLHLICKDCGSVTEMANSALQALGAEIRQLHGFEIEPRHFAINGLCRNCLEEVPGGA